jgi:outer membrane protein insertion porin family
MSRVRLRQSFASIDVQYTGPATISRERILAQMRTKVGLPYSDTVAENDIRALTNTGQVQNVRIFGQPEGDGVKVIVAVQTRTMLNEIQIDGATRISPKKLRKNLGVKLKTPLREEDLEKGRQKIMETYQAHGFQRCRGDVSRRSD